MDKLRLRRPYRDSRGATADDEASLAELRALSARLADVLRPHWPEIFTDYVPVEVEWPDDLAGTHVNVMTEAGRELHRMADAAAQIRRHYLDYLDGLIAARAEDLEDAGPDAPAAGPGSLAELEGLRSVIADLA